MSIQKTLRATQRIAPAPNEVIAENADILRIIEEAGGFVPNGFYALGWKPKVLELISKLSIAVLDEPGKISKELKWYVANLASRSAGCRYCWAHTANNAVALGDAPAEKVEALWEFRTHPLFNDAERAAMEFAQAGGSAPNVVEDGHFEEMRKYYDDEQIVELMSVIALFGWFNRWNDSMATMLEEEPLNFGKKHLGASGWEAGIHDQV